VPSFLDRQFAGLFGQGDHYYLGGPWKHGTPEQDYQLRFSPAQLYRAAIKAIDSYTMAHFNGTSFAKLSDADKDAAGGLSGEKRPYCVSRHRRGSPGGHEPCVDSHEHGASLR
jgi:hypothetical protein